MPQDLTESYVFEKDKNDIAWDTNDKDYFGVLKQFLKYAYPSDNFTFALDLTFSYIEKQPSYIAEFVQYARGELSFDKDDYQFVFFRQQTLFDKLYAAISNGRTPNLFRGIFYHIVNTFLQIAFQKAGGLDRDNSFTMYTFPIPDIPPIKDFRKRTWNFLFAEFDNHRKNVIEAIWVYTTKFNIWGVREVDNKKVFWEQDAKLLLPFIDRNFDTTSYQECKTAQEYFKELERMDIPFDESLKERFKNYKFELSLKLNQDLLNGRCKYDLSDDPKFKKENGQTDWRAVDNQKHKELEEYVDEYKFEDYKKLWRDVNELWEEEKDRNEWSIKTSFFQILRILAIKNIGIFLELLEYIFKDKGLSENFSSNYSDNIAGNALNSLKDKHFQLFDLINKFNGKSILHWKFAFFRQIDGKYANAYYTKQLLKCINEVEGYWPFFNFDFLTNFHYRPNVFEIIKGWFSKKVRTVNKNIYTKVTSILLEKAKTEKAKISFGRDFVSKHSAKFSSNFEFLKQVYFSNFKNDPHFDFDGKEMKTLCGLQPNFLIDFMKEFYDSEYSRIGKDLPNNFKFVWDFDKYTEVIDGLMEFAKEKNLVLMDWKHFAKKFFIANGPEEIDKRLHYIKSFIERNAESKEAIQLIFNVVTYSFPDKRLEYLKQFLKINQDTIIFEALSFHTNGVYSGSRIPIIEGRIEFMNQVEKMLETMPNSSAFIKHRAIVKNKIEYLKRDIAWEKKREFEDYFG